MNELALSINGVQYNLPGPIQNLDNAAGILGVNIINTAINLLFILATLVALFYLVWGGFNWIVSEGDQKKVQAARDTITYSVIGLSLIFVSFIIVNFLSNFFGIPLLGNS